MPPLQVTLSPPTKDQQEYLDDIKKRSTPLTQKEKDNILIPGPNFDKELSPVAPVNRAAARRRGWAYDHTQHAYRDKDGSLIADRFGQLL